MSDWIDLFPGLAVLDDLLKDRLTKQSRVMRASEGDVVFGPGKAPDYFLLVLSGIVRVQKTSESGREIVLYRVHARESCILTTACLFAHETYSAEGIAESDVDAVAIPRSVFEDLIARSEAFRRFVFDAYSRRIADLFIVIEEVAFRRVDIRLAQKLLELGDASDTVNLTHHQLATELGTAREVISRQLQDFQRRGWITRSRGRIEIADRAALRRFQDTA